MTQGIVDQLEAVEVQEHHGELAFVATRLGDAEIEPVFQQRPVRQMRQQIVIGLEVDDLLLLFALADIPGGAIGADKVVAGALLRIRINPFRSQLHPDVLGMQESRSSPCQTALQSHFNVVRGPITGTPFVEVVVRRLEIIVVDEFAVVFADELVSAVSEQRVDTVVDEGKAAVAVQHVHQVGRAVDDESIVLRRGD